MLNGLPQQHTCTATELILSTPVACFSCPHGANISWLFPNTVSCVVTQFDSDLCSGFPRFEAFEVKAMSSEAS